MSVKRIQLVITGFEDGGRDSQVKNYLEPGKSKETESPIEPSEGSTDSLVIHWFYQWDPDQPSNVENCKIMSLGMLSNQICDILILQPYKRNVLSNN